eukprot:TRINITY_DN34658_c0_g1_i1.p1 TRINITY_DN34658_c0_g1~~TRINITY_DN34658_c0_g1_i1.p1  ORF type:complete len:855 (-),score=142.89 TRINITY_DN34658_c0_g1_i1:443-3007(-)
MSSFEHGRNRSGSDVAAAELVEGILASGGVADASVQSSFCLGLGESMLEVLERANASPHSDAGGIAATPRSQRSSLAAMHSEFYAAPADETGIPEQPLASASYPSRRRPWQTRTPPSHRHESLPEEAPWNPAGSPGGGSVADVALRAWPAESAGAPQHAEHEVHADDGRELSPGPAQHVSGFVEAVEVSMQDSSVHRLLARVDELADDASPTSIGRLDFLEQSVVSARLDGSVVESGRTRRPSTGRERQSQSLTNTPSVTAATQSQPPAPVVQERQPFGSTAAPEAETLQAAQPAESLPAAASSKFSDELARSAQAPAAVRSGPPSQWAEAPSYSKLRGSFARHGPPQAGVKQQQREEQKKHIQTFLQRHHRVPRQHCPEEVDDSSPAALHVEGGPNDDVPPSSRQLAAECVHAAQEPRSRDEDVRQTSPASENVVVIDNSGLGTADLAVAAWLEEIDRVTAMVEAPASAPQETWVQEPAAVVLPNVAVNCSHSPQPLAEQIPMIAVVETAAELRTVRGLEAALRASHQPVEVDCAVSERSENEQLAPPSGELLAARSGVSPTSAHEALTGLSEASLGGLEADASLALDEDAENDKETELWVSAETWEALSSSLSHRVRHFVAGREGATHQDTLRQHTWALCGEHEAILELAAQREFVHQQCLRDAGGSSKTCNARLPHDASSDAAAALFARITDMEKDLELRREQAASDGRRASALAVEAHHAVRNGRHAACVSAALEEARLRCQLLDDQLRGLQDCLVSLPAPSDQRTHIVSATRTGKPAVTQLTAQALQKKHSADCDGLPAERTVEQPSSRSSLQKLREELSMLRARCVPKRSLTAPQANLIAGHSAVGGG